MSKIALSPNASGTGTFTIAAPDSNTDRVLTLPDEAGTVLTSASSITQNAGPAFSAYNSSNISCSNGTSTKITFDTERFDTHNCFNTATNRFTPNVAGYYIFHASVYSGDDPTNSFIKINKSGSDYTRSAQTAGGNREFTLAVMMYMNGTTDYVECYFDNNKGSTITINNYSFTQNFDGCLVRAA